MKKIFYIFIIVIILFGLYKYSNRKIECDSFVGGQFNLIYETNGGNNIDPVTICIACAPDTYLDIEIPIREGYVFDGWYYDEKLTKKVLVTSTLNINPVSKKDKNGCVIGFEDITLYAKWIKK